MERFLDLLTSRDASRLARTIALINTFAFIGAAGMIIGIVYADRPQLVGYACEVEPGEFVTLFARAESDFPPCATIERNFWAK